MSVRRHDIFEWAQIGRIAPENLRRALELGDVLPTRAQWRGFLDRLLLWLGAVMLGAAAVFFLAYNWDDLGRFAKFGLAQGLIVAALAVLGWQGLERATGKAALLAASIFTGALLALIGQTYQTGADPFELFAAWAAAILPWALLARFPALWVLWLVLVNLAVVLYFQAFHGIFGVLFGPERQLWLLFGLNTVALAAWEGFARAGVAWMHERWAPRLVATASGAMATALMLMEVFDRGIVGPGWAAWIGWMAAAYAVYRRRLKDVYVLAGGVLSAVIVVASLLVRALTEVRFEAGALLLIGLVVIGLSAAGGFWLRNVANEEDA
ncbi:MAG: DUF2157 domain-containing protein [Burkholderiales bacterium]